VHHRQGLLMNEVRFRHDVVELMEPEKVPAQGDPAPRVIRTNEFLAKPMTVDDAVMQMDLMNNDFLVFTNSISNEMNVVYRRKDGHYGLIEATPAAEERRQTG
jgi:putative sigma-54 modulation protein